MITRSKPISRSPISRVSAKAKREAKAKIAVKVYSDGREVLQRCTEGLAEYGLRIHLMAERQGDRCAMCGGRFNAWIGPPTFDHQRGRCAGKRDDRIVIDGEWFNAALCMYCNGEKGSRIFSWDSGLYLPVKEEANA